MVNPQQKQRILAVGRDYNILEKMVNPQPLSTTLGVAIYYNILEKMVNPQLQNLFNKGVWIITY